jgi:hypothetical protein
VVSGWLPSMLLVGFWNQVFAMLGPLVLWCVLSESEGWRRPLVGGLLLALVLQQGGHAFSALLYVCGAAVVVTAAVESRRVPLAAAAVLAGGGRRRGVAVAGSRHAAEGALDAHGAGGGDADGAEPAGDGGKPCPGGGHRGAGRVPPLGLRRARRASRAGRRGTVRSLVPGAHAGPPGSRGGQLRGEPGRGTRAALDGPGVPPPGVDRRPAPRGPRGRDDPGRTTGPRGGGGPSMDGGPVGDLHDTLDAGLRPALLAAGDGHDGRPGRPAWGAFPGGLAGLEVEELTRAGILDAIRSGRIWGTTGERTVLQVRWARSRLFSKGFDLCSRPSTLAACVDS